MEKIKRLTKELIDQKGTDIRELLSITESPIEKLFLLYTISYIEVSMHEELYPEVPKDAMLVSIDGYKYERNSFDKNIKENAVRGLSLSYVDIHGKGQSDGSGYDKFLSKEGKIINMKVSAPSNKNQNRIQNLKIYPQYKVETSNYSYRLDFAFMLFENVDNVLKLSKKIGIECDGYEHHSSKKRFSKDRERIRNLISDDWKMLSFSGSEINKEMYDNKKYLNEIGKIFKTIDFGNMGIYDVI